MIIVKEDPSQYPLPPEGLHAAVCVDAVDLGEIQTQFGAKHKVSFIWELELADDDGNRFVIGKRYTKSLNEKANLRKDLERWMTKKFTAEQLTEGIDLEQFIGKSATLFVTHNPTDERTFANVESVMPYKGDDGEQVKPSGNYIRVIDREGYKPPEEYAEMVNGS